MLHPHSHGTSTPSWAKALGVDGRYGSPPLPHPEPSATKIAPNPNPPKTTRNHAIQSTNPEAPSLDLLSKGIHYGSLRDVEAFQAGKALSSSILVSPRKINPELQGHARRVLENLVQDVHLHGHGPPLSQQGAAAPNLRHKDRANLTAERDFNASSNGDGVAEQALREDPHNTILRKRIPASEKMKWTVDNDPPCLKAVRVRSALKAPSVGFGEVNLFGSAGNGQHRTSHPSAGKFSMSSMEEEGWVVVKPRFWWRGKIINHGGNLFHQEDEVKRASFFKKKFQGKCYNYLLTEHYAFRCWAPPRCWCCLRSGHKAESCPDKINLVKSNSKNNHHDSLKHSLRPIHCQGANNTTHTVQQHRPSTTALQKGHEQLQRQPHNLLPRHNSKSYLEAAQGNQDMAARYPGDPRARPSRAFCAISVTSNIRRRRDELINKAVVCSYDGNSHEVDTLFAGPL